ncbi:MAG: FHA domain-containing protein [Candidatus Aminicenantes bacterium]|nr:FHA domain-containing protein [Candidatus Aminicenantes bacterium]NIM80954.1 FHA domain-containing protein [Candidatus Aminicenantes bacterium]NIN20336.1 FHA domain-containing protein [Candidatus Aminicenantes bacterium]NIN44111.1 FHA domain-containing protein [Candidatus Aminicenantes bacterium]NIN86924.1 FHA domain-containing protein [Candidatus Aminicenantes bacterium]
MSIKSFINKLVPRKDKKPPGTPTPASDVPPFPELEVEVTQPEVSFEKLDTRIEKVGTVPEIHVYVNDEKTNIHTLAAETKIGRDPSQSDIIISELIVSKLHCTIYSRNNDFFIEDNNSTNGVFVNHERVTDEQKIENGDIIMLGRKGTVKLVFHKR